MQDANWSAWHASLTVHAAASRVECFVGLSSCVIRLQLQTTQHHPEPNWTTLHPPSGISIVHISDFGWLPPPTYLFYVPTSEEQRNEEHARGRKKKNKRCHTIGNVRQCALRPVHWHYNPLDAKKKNKIKKKIVQKEADKAIKIQRKSWMKFGLSLFFFLAHVSLRLPKRINVVLSFGFMCAPEYKRRIIPRNPRSCLKLWLLMRFSVVSVWSLVFELYSICTCG